MIAALVVAFAGVLLKGTRGEPHPIVLVVLAVAIGFLGWRAYNGHRLEDRLGRVARTRPGPPALLGATPTQAQTLAERYWTDYYPRLPDDYSSVDCRDGGSLDRHPASPSWP